MTDYQVVQAYETVNHYARGPVAKLELNRPERLNAWDDQFSADLLGALSMAGADPAVRAVLICGAGRAFSAGADLSAVSGESGPPDLYRHLTEKYHPILLAIRQMPKPVIAAVHGAAAGIGLSLALACDLVLAAESGYFLLAFANIGLVPDGGASLFVPARVGAGRAAEMAMLGERVGARQALEWGLINQVWPDAELSGRADELAARLADGPTRAYAGVKRQINHWLYDGLAGQLEFEARLQQELGSSADHGEGVMAFKEKRRPRFTGN